MPDDDLSRYIRENRARYTREAITEQLIAAGHEPAAIDAAWIAVEEEERANAATINLRPRATRIVLAAYILVWLAFGLVGGGGQGGVLFAAGLYFGIGLLVSLFIISVWGGFQRADPERVVIVLVGGLVIPFVILFGLLGFCVWFISQLTF